MSEGPPPPIPPSKRRETLPATAEPQTPAWAPPPLSEAELRESVKLLPEVVASISDRLDDQAPILHRVDAVLHNVDRLARAAQKANRLADRSDDRLERAAAGMKFQAAGMSDTVATAQRTLDDLRNASYRSGHVIADALDAAEAWRANTRRLALWAAPAALVLLLGLAAASALLAPRLLPRSEPLCTLAGGAWVEDTGSARHGCWMEAGP